MFLPRESDLEGVFCFGPSSKGLLDPGDNPAWDESCRVVAALRPIHLRGEGLEFKRRHFRR